MPFQWHDQYKKIDPKRIKVDEKSYKNIIYHTGYVTIKDLSYITTNRVKPLYLIIKEINEYIEKSNGNKF